jgi:hypothetical protein
VSNKPGTRKAQEHNAAAPKNSNAVEVGNGATRYDWSIAFSRMCLRKEYPAIAIAAAMRLVEELPRRCGQCAPLRDDIAAELGRDIRTIDRGYKVLEDDGWIRRQRGGRDDPVTITLLIPAEDADIHRFGNKSGVGKRDMQVSHLEPVHMRHKTGSYATQNGSIRDTQGVASKEQIQKEQSAASPRATGLADREENAFRELIELRPLSDPSQEPTARAAYGALLKTTSIDDIIDEACTFEKRPEDCISFLAYLAANKPSLTLASS